MRAVLCALFLASGCYDLDALTDRRDSSVDAASLDGGIDAGPSVSLFAGALGGGGNVDGPDTVARLWHPQGVLSDGQGGWFIIDTDNNAIRQESNGVVATVAGNVLEAGFNDATGTKALFFGPTGGVLVGNTLYVTDTQNNRIRAVDVTTHAVTTVAGSGSYASKDGTPSGSAIGAPLGITAIGAVLYIVDPGCNCIRTIDPSASSPRLTTFAGAVGGMADHINGTGSVARFSSPYGITTNGSMLYVGDSNNRVIRAIDSSATVADLAGMVGQSLNEDGGLLTGSAFTFPNGIVWVGNDQLFVIDNDEMRELDLATKMVTTVAGQYSFPGYLDGDEGTSKLDVAAAATIGVQSASGAAALYFPDKVASVVRILSTSSNNAVSHFLGAPDQAAHVDGTATSARFSAPAGIAIANGIAYVADFDAVRAVDLSTRDVTTLTQACEVGGGDSLAFSRLQGIAFDGASTLYISDSQHAIICAVDVSQPGGATTLVAGMPMTSGSSDGTKTSARFSTPAGIAVAQGGGPAVVYVADANNATIRRIDPGGVVTTVAGQVGVMGNRDGAGTSASFAFPYGLAVDDTANLLYVADVGTHTIRRVMVGNGTYEVSTIAGLVGQPGHVDGAVAVAQFYQPTAIAVDGAGSLYVTESVGAVVRQIDLGTRQVSTVAGVPGQAAVTLGPLSSPQRLTRMEGIAVLPDAGGLLVAATLESALLLIR